MGVNGDDLRQNRNNRRWPAGPPWGGWGPGQLATALEPSAVYEIDLSGVGRFLVSYKG